MVGERHLLARYSAKPARQRHLDGDRMASGFAVINVSISAQYSAGARHEIAGIDF